MRALIAALLLLVVTPGLVLAQSTEDKLRDALRHATVDLRALQDAQAQLQADRDSALKQRDALQQQLNEANAKAAPDAANPQAAQANPDDLKRLQDALAAAQGQNAELVASNAKWQGAYQQAAGIAQTKDAESKRTAQSLQAAQKENQLSRETNAKLAGLANDILHLYETQDFRHILIRSYEPVLGLDKVKLDNMIQDYDDKIYDLRLYPKAQQQ